MTQLSNSDMINYYATRIDEDLIDRMRAVRSLCELGHRVRAEAKIRNRQPLRTAYVLFNDTNITDFLIYCDRNDEYINIFKDELNVLDIQYVHDDKNNKFFNINLKPDFRSLAAKGFGKQANLLKKDLASLSNDERLVFWNNLKENKTTEIVDITITIDDVIVEYLSKDGYASAHDKIGAIILDTKLDDDLLERGFIADFRSFVQNTRKAANLNLTDRIQIEIDCSEQRKAILLKDRFNYRLCKDLLLSKLDFKPITDVNIAHKFVFEKETIPFLMFVENK